MNANWKTRVTQGAKVSDLDDGYRLEIPAGDNKSYRVAQLDDYTKLARRDFSHRPTLSLEMRARVSAKSLPGTWGFGLWNDPFGLSIGFGGNPFHLPALPNAVWFFHASKENYLSFDENPGNGFLAQVFRSPVFPVGRLAKVSATFPFSRAKARRSMGKVVDSEAINLEVDITQWHGYRLEWSEKRSVFWVDGAPVLETSVSPRPPLGLVIWIDNQYAAWRPDGKFGFGILENNEAWLEVKEIEEKRP